MQNARERKTGEIKVGLEIGESHTVLAAGYGVSRRTIRKMDMGELWA